MPKNKGKGGKNRRRGKNENDREKRELIFKEDGQEYAQVLKMLGNGRLEAMCFDGTKRLCHIRGKLRKKVWINQSDIILIGLRDYQDAKADVIMKYSADEARNLKLYGELPDNARINDTFAQDDADEIIMFDEVATEEEVEKKADYIGITSSEEETDSEDEEEEVNFTFESAATNKGKAGRKHKGGGVDVDDI